jgi:hypothetical protein
LSAVIAESNCKIGKDMRSSLKRYFLISLVSLAVGVTFAGSTLPALADGAVRSVGHSGGGNFSSGGHAGGNRGGYGAAVGLGVAGFAAGAALGADGTYYNSCPTYPPVYDEYGNLISQC